jgi:hypothetical protein
VYNCVYYCMLYVYIHVTYIHACIRVGFYIRRMSYLVGGQDPVRC